MVLWIYKARAALAERKYKHSVDGSCVVYIKEKLAWVQYSEVGRDIKEMRSKRCPDYIRHWRDFGFYSK